MKLLVVDVGGTRIKFLASEQTAHRKFASGSEMTAMQMVAGVRKASSDWQYGTVSIGFPGAVLHGKITMEPHNLGDGWVGYDFEKAFGCPVNHQRRGHAGTGQLQGKRQNAVSRTGYRTWHRHDRRRGR